jgi:hypothetical protein
MGAVEKLEQLAGLLECPVCDKLLHEPVVYGVCLHVFCRACSIKASLGLLSVCPMCQEVTNGANVVPVPLIAKLVEVIKEGTPKRQRSEDVVVVAPSPPGKAFAADLKRKRRPKNKDDS